MFYPHLTVLHSYFSLKFSGESINFIFLACSKLSSPDSKTKPEIHLLFKDHASQSMTEILVTIFKYLKPSI